MGPLAIVAPIFLLIGLGMWARKLGILDEPTVKKTNALLYWLCLPALLFYKTYRLPFGVADVGPALGALVLGSLASVALGFVLSWGMRLSPPGRAAFLQAGFRGNLAFVGLPVALFYLRSTGQETAGTEGKIYLLLAPGIVFYNLFGVVILMSAQLRFQAKAWGRMGLELGKNPLILSILAGLLYQKTGLGLWEFLDRTLETLSGAVLPLALIGVGASAKLLGFSSYRLPEVVAALTKVVLTPLLGFGFSWWLGLREMETRILVILMIAPTAPAAFILSQQLKADAEMTAKVLVLSVLFSLGAYGVALWLLEQWPL